MFPLWYLGVCDGCREIWDPDRCGHWGFQVSCVPGYWELILRDGNVLGLTGLGLQKRKERLAFLRICSVSTLGVEAKMR